MFQEETVGSQSPTPFLSQHSSNMEEKTNREEWGGESVSQDCTIPAHIQL